MLLLNGGNILLYHLDEGALAQRFSVHNFAVDDTGLGKTLPNAFGVNRFILFNIRLAHRLVCQPRLGFRQFTPGIGLPHIIQLLLFCFSQIGATLYHGANLLFDCRPAHQHVAVLRTVRQLDAFGVIVHETAITVQIGMAVSTGAVFFFQKILRILGRWIPVIQRRDTELTPSKAGAAAQHILDFFFRNRKCRGLSLCTGCRDWYGWFFDHSVNVSDLFRFAWDEETHLLYIRFGQA